VSDAPEKLEQGESTEGIDWVTVLYIAGGIPAMVGFFIGLFVLVRLFDIPA
jgi:hypothetical protein